MADIQEDALDAAVSSLCAVGHKVLGVRTDISRHGQIELLAERAVSAYGKVNIVHNNAGMVLAAIKNNNFWILTHPEWKHVTQDRVEGLLRSQLVLSGLSWQNQPMNIKLMLFW